MFTCFSSDNFSNIMYEFLQDFFVPNDFMNDFNLFFEVCERIAHGHVPSSVSCLFLASLILTLQKQNNDIQPIMIKEVIYLIID